MFFAEDKLFIRRWVSESNYLPTKRGQEVRKHSVFNNYMIYNSTGHSEK